MILNALMIHRKLNLCCYQVIKEVILPEGNSVTTENWETVWIQTESEED